MGCTPLHYAATFNNLEVARLLIHSGANLNLIDNDRCTALHQAALEGFADIGELLIDSCEYDKSRVRYTQRYRDNYYYEALCRNNVFLKEINEMIHVCTMYVHRRTLHCTGVL